MKFLCPSCKAKYQIADEKVAGRQVRMKCRKCGFVIPLSEIPTAPTSVPPGEEGAVAPAIPKAPLAPTGTAPAAPKAPSPAAPAVSAAKPASPAAPSVGAVKPASPAAPAVGPAKPGAPAAPPAVSAKPAVPPRRPTLADVAIGPAKPGAPVVRPAAPSAPGTPSAAIPAPPAARPAAPGARPATPAPAPKPAVTPAAAAAAAAVAPAASSAAAVSLLSALEEEEDENDDATHILKGGALADAFGALVGAAPVVEATGQVVGMPADEWFVGINDVPVGPIRLGEIRKRAMLGAITPDAMVWRDGLEAWRPLKTFPELLAVLEESVSSVRAAPVPLLPSGDEVPPPKSDGDSFAAAGAAGSLTGPAVVTDEIALGQSRGRSPLFVWFALVVAVAFGITIGFVFWSKQKPPETIVKYVEVPAKGPATPAAAVDPQAVDPTTPAASAAAAAAKARSGSGSGSGKVASTKTTDGAQPASTGLAGLKGLSGLGPSGPGVTGSGPGTGPASGGGQLDAAQTQSTVARYTGSVKRSCWQPALDARDPSAPTSARVMVTITVGPSGSVQNVSTNGDPRGYPGLAPCIAGRVRAWQFPATGGTTTVNVPFVFAAQ